MSIKVNSGYHSVRKKRRGSSLREWRQSGKETPMTRPSGGCCSLAIESSGDTLGPSGEHRAVTRAVYAVRRALGPQETPAPTPLSICHRCLCCQTAGGSKLRTPRRSERVGSLEMPRHELGHVVYRAPGFGKKRYQLEHVEHLVQNLQCDIHACSACVLGKAHSII